MSNKNYFDQFNNNEKQSNLVDKRQLSKLIFYSKKIAKINEILFDIHDSICYILNLDNEYKIVLQNYTADMAFELNQELRQNSLSDSSKHNVSVMDQIFKNCPKTKHPIVIYRGLTNVKTNDFITKDSCFVSCTLDRQKAFNYA